MNFANDILDAIEIMVKQVVEDNATKIYTGVCKTIGTNDCVLTINGKDNTVKYYGGVPVVGTVYQVFIPFGNMSAAFIIVPGSGGGSGGGSGVDSVNGKTGDVVLSASDVGAYPNGIKGAVNCDDLSDGTWTISARSTNGPGAFACTLFHKDWNADFASQFAFGANHNVYYRVKTGGSWLAWQEMYSTLRYPSPSKIGLGNVDNIKQYSEINPPPYPVVSVNGKTGGVNLVASDVGAVSTNNITQTLGTSTTKVPSEKAVTDAIAAAGGESGGSGVDSVNGKTGDVVLNAADVGALPTSGGTLTGNLTVGSANIQTNGYVVGTWLQGTATNHLTNAATKIAVQDGSGWVYHRTAEEIKSDIGLSNVDNVKQYSASNPPPYPVASVNGKTGRVNLVASDVGAVSTNNITQTLGTSTTKVPSEKAVTDAMGAAGYGDMLKSVYDATGAIANGGGIVDYIKSSGFTFLGTDPISSTSSDTTTNWAALGTGYAWYDTTGLLINQPNQWGFVINYKYGGDIFQIWKTQNSGPMYYRSGNTTGWGKSWTKILDATDLIVSNTQPSGQAVGGIWYQTT